MSKPKPDIHDGRIDTYPEGLIGRSYFQDTGCWAVTTCLACPLEACLEDRRIDSDERAVRNETIMSQIEAGHAREEIAKHFRIAMRTIDRVVAKSKKQARRN